MKNEHFSWLNSKSEELTSCYQYDSGQKIVFKKHLPVGAEVQFEDGTIKLIANDEIGIPDSILSTSGKKSAYVQIIGDDNETTVYKLSFNVIARTQKDDYVTPAEEPSFRQQIQSIIADKQDTLVAGDHITITGNVISSEIGMTASEKTQLQGKQDKLTAGSHITISGNTISAEAGMTESERSQLTTATTDIASIKQDLSDKVNSYTQYGFTVANKRVYNATGKLVTSNGQSATEYIPCEPGTTVKYAGTSFIYQGEAVMYLIAFFDSSKTLISGIDKISSETVSTFGTVSSTAPDDTAYVVASTNGTSNAYLRVYDIDVPVMQADVYDLIEELDNISDTENTVDVGYFDIGNINIDSSGWRYSTATSRVRTKEGTTIQLKTGDVVRLTDYTKGRFYLGWQKSDGTYGYKGWITDDYTCQNDGMYVILLHNISGAAVSSSSELVDLLRIEKAYDDKLLVGIRKKVVSKIEPEIGSIYPCGAIPSYYIHTDDQRYIDFNTERSTFTIPGDIIYYRIVDGKREILNTQLGKKVVDCSGISSSAIFLWFDYNKKSYVAMAYTSSVPKNYIFVAGLRKKGEKSLMSCIMPWSIDGKPYGIEQLYKTNNSNVRSVNHRGYGTAPENTLSAYRLSKKMGFDYVETDVSMTSDKVPVLLHDDTIDRTSNGTGSISGMTFEQVRQYDFGSWKSTEYAGEQIPSFEEFILLCKKLGLHPYIELKPSGGYTQTDVNNCVDIVERYGMRGNVTWISFTLSYLKWVKERDQSARLGYVMSNVTQDAITSAVDNLRTSTNEVFIDTSTVTDAIVQMCMSVHMPLEQWTVDGKANIADLNPYVSGVTSNTTNAGRVMIASEV